MQQTNKNLLLAQKNLEFEDLFQTQVRSFIADNFEPKYTNYTKNISIEFKHDVISSVVIRLKKKKEEKLIFRVNVTVAVRYQQGSEQKGEKDFKTVAQIEATYSIDYFLKNNELLKNKIALDEFALKNASHHLWPFWREFVMAQAQRMNLPHVPLPLRLPG